MNSTLEPNKWYLCLTSGLDSLALPSSPEPSTGDIVKVTVNSNVIANASQNYVMILGGPIYGETGSGWGIIGNSTNGLGNELQVDLPQTMTFIYQRSGNGISARWNLVESIRI